MAKYIAVLCGLLLVGGLGLAQAGGGEISLPPPEDEIAALEAAFGEVIGFFSSFIEEFKGSVAQINERFASLEGALADLIAWVQDLDVRLSGLCDQVAEHGGRIGALEDWVGDLEERVTYLEEQDIGAVQRQLLAVEQAIQALQVKIDNNRAKIEGIEAALGGFQEEISAVRGEMDQLKGQVAAQVDAQLAAVQEELAAIKAAQETQWAAIFLVPALVGALVYFLITSGG
ncbi:TPA: hypothetical protein EYP84_03435 [Candidatus Bipolaricaulota bacterium]|nr:hypothetical protein [Candidatus Bipolaricaulota bacterium]HIP99643.1 hypothetical protein [Candidatus Bipolaricaulota bacterium]